MDRNLKVTKNSLSFHLVGILGIGMSALAQYLKYSGYNVSGSDRAIEFPENYELTKKLTSLGIKLYHQDGSFVFNEQVDYIVYSSAIEDDNPDFKVSKDIPRLHRTETLVKLFNEEKNNISIAIAGTCGKTSVSSIVAETFEKLGLEPLAIVGGFVNSFSSNGKLGNFRYGKGGWLVYETDESDKSLLSFKPDYSILLNIGTDHYSKEELIDVFENFLKKTKKGAVIEKSLLKIINKESYRHLDIVLFSSNPSVCDNAWYYDCYKVSPGNIEVIFKKDTLKKKFSMPMPGEYNAMNFLSVLALYELLRLDMKIPIDDYLTAMSTFNGVHRRFEFVGVTKVNFLHIYCDFAHNVEKITSAIKCAQELTKGRVFAIFQAHGYKPFGFMVDDLYDSLEKTLRECDRFILLPVYYSGGTSSFKPKVSEVVAQYAEKSRSKDKYYYFDNRTFLEKYLKSISRTGDIVLIMGARDNSLPIWSKHLIEVL